jgi:PAS domain S-box-containing protein
MGQMRPPSILVVDDDEGLLLLMAETLRSEGYEVATADSGASALAWLEKNSADLLLLDLKMKDVGGQALVEQLKQHRGAIPFLVVTGQGDEKVAVDVMKQGALDYVMKNTALLDLLPGVVRRAVDAIGRDRELRATQVSLRESEARFSAAVRAANEGVWQWHLRDERAYFSPRWKAMLGYAPDEISDQWNEWWRQIHPEDAVRVEKAFKDFLQQPDAAFAIEYRLKHKDGSYRWVLSRAVLERDAAGQPAIVTGASADITGRKQLEKEILNVSDREQRRIGQDLHDGLGQQLAAIELMCESLKSDISRDNPGLRDQVSRLAGFLREAIGQTRALAHGLTSFMLDASGLQAALAELCDRTVAMARVKCRFVCPETVLLDDSETAGHLYRIAQEAVGNALKHAQATEVIISLRGGDGQVVLTVADNGKGLPKATKTSRGIGLQVMRHRADTIGAELTVTAKRGKGVTVTVTLRRNPRA